ncbi:OmpH family outer membrane protein [Pseudohalocynthiibacter aestuariivivens]|jgi:Skp family chaperone for outer membrane proteins|uniref:OmpH family outer membrane protein n=1 Tax=Pseudohalocynthiibacter aestuariivivens TaxID=1591409 RepID=A0ABV5JGA1_9RHOB|nr:MULTISPECIES: OmpH family outer membrane protein [Pseudohalocynthiibacter]MBS9716175.1 OmpH family outer membrane protein [Pseudohalocynthiibacter aestuariivivens]
MVLVRAIFSCAIALFLCSGLANAQESGGSSSALLTIDAERLYLESRYGGRVQSEFERDGAELAAENQTIDRDLTAEEKDLTERRATMPADEFRLLADEFDVKVQGIRRAQDDKLRSLTRRRDEERQTFYSTVIPVLAQITSEKGAVAILDRRAVFLAAESIDITNDAIERVDAEIGDGTSLQSNPEE